MLSLIYFLFRVVFDSIIITRMVATSYIQSYAVPPFFLRVAVLCSILSYLIDFFATTRNTMSERLFFLGWSLRKSVWAFVYALESSAYKSWWEFLPPTERKRTFQTEFFFRSIRLYFCRASLFSFFSLWHLSDGNYNVKTIFRQPCFRLDGMEMMKELREDKKQKTHYFIVQCTYICSVQPTDFCGH